MFVSQFGEVEWNDPQSMWEFLCAHDVKHQALAQTLANRGAAVPAFLLSSQIDEAWVQTHAQQHALLAQATTPGSGSSAYDLLTNPMSDEDTFYQWHDIHDLLHQQLDQALGIGGT